MNDKKGLRNIALLGVLAAVIASGGLWLFSGSVSANHLTYTTGDVFAGVGSGRINRYTNAGVFVEQLDTTSGSSEETGMCFDSNNPATANLRSTNFSVNNMTRFNNMGGAAVPWAGPFSSDPESCVVDTSGNIYVGQADGSGDILKFKADGTAGTPPSFNPPTGPRGSDWIDLSADQHTMLYTSEGNLIRRFDVSTNTPLADFNPLALPSSPCYALRIRANGDVLVACSTNVFRLDKFGALAQTYPRPATESSFLFALNLDPDGTSFWTAGYSSPKNIYRIRISDGFVMTTIVASASPGTQGPTLAGLAIFGEPIASQSTPTPNPTFCPGCPVGGLVALPIAGSGSDFPWMMLIATVSGALPLLAAGLWYGRKRSLP